MFSRWTRLRGVSRGTRISFRRSLRWTSAARVTRFVVIPWAIARQGAHAARRDHHPGRPERPAGDPGAEVGLVVVDQPARRRGRRTAAGSNRSRATARPGLLAEDLGAAGADGQVDRPPGPAEDLQEPDGIGGAAGPGHRQDERGLGRHPGPAGRLGADVERGDPEGQRVLRGGRPGPGRRAGRASPGRRGTGGRWPAGSCRRRTSSGAIAWPTLGRTCRKKVR